jgi:hypothetical protein
MRIDVVPDCLPIIRVGQAGTAVAKQRKLRLSTFSHLWRLSNIVTSFPAMRRPIRARRHGYCCGAVFIFRSSIINSAN